MPRSLQEKVVLELSRHLLGSHALFLPNLYGTNGLEPCDIAWVANRCAVLMYMTSGKKRFEKKRDHNLKQLNRWLKHWKAGQTLTGDANGRSYSFAFSDVDHVIGLSIVGGDDVRCEYHSDQLLRNSALNLRSCGSITETCIRRLAALGAGPRDLLFFIEELRNTFFFRSSEQRFLNLINDHVNAQIIVLAHRFPAHNTQIYNHHLILSETSRIFASLRANALEEQSLGEIGADLRMIDNLWFGFAGASLETAIAPIGEDGSLVTRSKVDTGRYCLQYFAAANLELVKNHINEVIGAVPASQSFLRWTSGWRRQFASVLFTLEQDRASFSANLHH